MNLFSYKLIGIYVLYCLLLLPFHAQADQVDSLIQLLPELKGKERVDALNEIAWKLKYSRSKLAIQYGEESTELASNIAYTKGLASAYYNLCVFYNIRNKYDRSNEYADLAIQEYQKFEDLIAIAKCWNMIGLNNLTLGNHQLALKHFNKSLEQFKIVNKQESVLLIEANIGNVYYRMGELDTALQSYLSIVEYARDNNKESALITNLQNVGLVYTDIGKYAQSLECSFEVLNLLRARNDSSILPNTLLSIASTYNSLNMYDESIKTIRESIFLDKILQREMHLASSYITLANAHRGNGEVDSALHYYEIAKTIYEKLGNKSTGIVLVNIGRIFFDKGQLNDAEILFQEALKVSELQNRKGSIAQSKYNLGRLYFTRNEFDRAESFLLEAYQYLDESKNYSDLSSVTKELASLYSMQGKHELAFNFQEQYNLAQDSIFSRKKQNELMMLLVEQRLKESESIAHDIENKEEQNTIVYYWVIAFILLLSGLATRAFFEKNKKRIRELQLDLDKSGRELAFLSLSAMQKDSFIMEFTEKLKPLVHQNPENSELKSLLRNLKMQEIQSDNWNRFKAAFERIAPHFFDHLLTNYNSLTETDLRFCALIRLSVPTKEIAKIVGISNTSVNKARYRLRKRLGISREENLDRFIQSI